MELARKMRTQTSATSLLPQAVPLLKPRVSREACTGMALGLKVASVGGTCTDLEALGNNALRATTTLAVRRTPRRHTRFRPGQRNANLQSARKPTPIPRPLPNSEVGAAAKSQPPPLSTSARHPMALAGGASVKVEQLLMPAANAWQTPPPRRQASRSGQLCAQINGRCLSDFRLPRALETERATGIARNVVQEQHAHQAMTPAEG